MKKNAVMICCFLMLLFSGCAEKSEETPAPDFSKVPKEITIETIENDVDGFWNSKITDKKDIEKIWIDLDTQHWTEKEFSENYEYLIGHTISFAENDIWQCSIIIGESLAKVRYERDKDEGMEVKEYFYTIPSAVYGNIEKEIESVFEKETKDIQIDDIEKFVKESFQNEPITVLAGTPYESHAKFSYESQSEITDKIIQGLGDISAWKKIDSNTFSTFPNTCEYSYSVEFHFTAEGKESRGFTVYQKDNVSYIAVSYGETADIYYDSKVKPFYYYTEEDMIKNLVPILEEYRDSGKVEILE